MAKRSQLFDEVELTRGNPRTPGRKSEARASDSRAQTQLWESPPQALRTRPLDRRKRPSPVRVDRVRAQNKDPSSTKKHELRSVTKE